MRTSNATTDHTNWNFNEHHVQAELTAGEFMSAESILISSGPPSLSMIQVGDNELEGGVVFPVGTLEQFNLGQNQQLQPVFEIGSSRAYYIPGKSVGSLQLGRVLFSGPSLLKVLYAYYKQSNAALKYQFMFKDKDALLAGTPNGYNIPDPQRMLLDAEYQKSLVGIEENPGYGDFFINLGSDLFKQPLGLMIYVKNSMGQPYGGAYIENCYIGSHQLSLQAGANIILEGASLQFDKVVPVKVVAGSYIPALAN